MSKKNGLPPMERRPIYVAYVAVRRCRRNPSWTGFDKLPKLHQDFLLDKWIKRHPGKQIP